MPADTTYSMTWAIISQAPQALQPPAIIMHTRPTTMSASVTCLPRTDAFATTFPRSQISTTPCQHSYHQRRADEPWEPTIRQQWSTGSCCLDQQYHRTLLFTISATVANRGLQWSTIPPSRRSNTYRTGTHHGSS
jgi:hypothetical protein